MYTVLVIFEIVLTNLRS